MAALRSLLDRGPTALTPPAHAPSPDRAPDSLVAGTSLSGQAQTAGIVVDVRRHFRGVEDGPAPRRGERTPLMGRKTLI